MSARSKKPTERPPAIPAAPELRLEDQKTSVFDSGNFKREASTPLKMISMKKPDTVEVEPANNQLTPHIQRPKMRAISDMAAAKQTQTQSQNLGFLAPPFNPAEGRARKLRDYVIWGSLAVILASFVALAMWFIAR